MTISGDKSLSLYPCALITRIDIVAEILPSWPFLQGAESVEDIAEEAFQQRFDPEEYAASRRQAWDKPGAHQVGFTELELTDGPHLFWEVQMASRALMASDVANLGKPLLASGGLHTRRQNGGIMVINPAHIVRQTLNGGPGKCQGRLSVVRLLRVRL